MIANEDILFPSWVALRFNFDEAAYSSKSNSDLRSVAAGCICSKIVAWLYSLLIVAIKKLAL